MATDPFFGPVKATIEVACGQKEDAKKTIENFKEGNPVVLGVRGVYHGVKGDTEKGRDLRKKCGTNTKCIANGVADAIPGLGQGKAVYHYLDGDKEKGHKAMKSSSRSTAGLVGSMAGMTAGSGPGAVAGYVTGVSVADGVISAVDSMVHGKKLLHGNLATWDKARKEPTVGNGVEVIIGYGLDCFAGITAAGNLESALCGDAAASTDVSSMSDACAGDAPDVSGAAEGCGGDAPDVSGAAEGCGGDAADATAVSDTPGNDTPGVDAAKADVAPKAGENLPFVGDEIKFVRGAKAIIMERFGGGGEGAAPLDGLSDDVRKIVPDDLKMPEVNPSIGETVTERFDNMTLLVTEDPGGLAKVALIPDKKRDWIQDVGESKP